MSDLAHDYVKRKYSKYHQCEMIMPWVTEMPNPGQGPGRHYGRIDCLYCKKFIRWATKKEMEPGGNDELDPNGIPLKYGYMYARD